jgi:transcription elongation factor Elf1
MAQTLCIKCGSELKVSSSCNLCQEPLTFACTSCEYTTEEKVHTDCRNAKVLAKTADAKEEESTTTTASRPTSNRNQEEAIVDKHKEEEEKVKAEPRSAPSYMTTKEDNKDLNNVNPFVAGTAIWQSLMTYWFNAYGEFLKSAPKMTEYWYNTFWKPWLNWGPKQQQQGQDKVE